MRFYKRQRQFYCGVDLHAKTMDVCLVDQAGEALVGSKLKTEPDISSSRREGQDGILRRPLRGRSSIEATKAADR